MRKILLLIVVTLLLSLCACSVPADDQSGMPPETGTRDKVTVGIIEPSALVSREEAENILGVSLNTVEALEQEKVGLKQCMYEQEDRFFQIGLTQQAMMPPEQTQTPESLFRAIVDNFEDAARVEGIGNEAYFATPGLHILQDDYYILIAIGNLNDEANREKLKEAGKLAVRNLKAVTGSNGGNIDDIPDEENHDK